MGVGEAMGITLLERRILRWVEAHLDMIVLVAVTLLGVLLRFSLRHFQSNDYRGFLGPWYDEIKANGGVAGLGTLVGNYNVLYQLCIALLTYLPIGKITAYKLLSCSFDLLLAWGAGSLAAELRGGYRRRTFTLVYGAVLLSPVVFLNSAAWAQCDSIWTSLCVVSLLLLVRKRPVAAYLAYGLAWSFKLQSVFLLPLFVYAWYRERDHSLLCLLAVPLVMLATGLPAIASGVDPLQVFSIYYQQTVEHEATLSHLVVSYPGLWALLAPAKEAKVFGAEAYDLVKGCAMALACGLVLLEAYALARRARSRETAPDLVHAALLFSLTMVCTLPAMHERYGFLCEVLAIVCVAEGARWAAAAVPMHLATLATYGSYLFRQPTLDLHALAAINLLSLAGVAWLTVRGSVEEAKRLCPTNTKQSNATRDI